MTRPFGSASSAASAARAFGAAQLARQEGSEHDVGEQVEGEPGQRCELRVVEGEDLRHEDPDEDAADEPAIPGDPRDREPDDPDQDEEAPTTDETVSAMRAASLVPPWSPAARPTTRDEATVVMA